MRSFPGLFLSLAIALVAPSGAIDLTLGPAEIERALGTGRASDAERARFHAPYLVALKDPTAEQIEVITEFRRVVLAAEDHIRRGDHVFSMRQATEEARPSQGKLTLVLHLRFHPQNVLMRVPAYELVIGPALRALDVRRTPLYALAGPRQKGASPIVGGIVECEFGAGTIGQTSRAIMVLLEGNEIAETTIDFARLE